MNPNQQHLYKCWPPEHHIKYFFILFLSLFLVISSHAQKIADWPLTGTVAGTGTAFNTVSNITGGPDIPTLAFNGYDFFGQDGWPAASTLSTSAYLQFSITPHAGYQLDLTSVVMKIRRSTTGTPSGSGPLKWALRSNLDGFTADLGSGTLTTSYKNESVSLSGFYFLTGTVTFRLYGYNIVINPTGLNRLVAGNIYINGLVTLPLIFTSFNAQYLSGDNVQLQWQAQNVTNGSNYYLQRSVDGINFKDIWTKSTNSAADTIQYIDKQLPATAPKLYYRVRTQDPGGRFALSPVVNISRQGAVTTIDKIITEGSSVKLIALSSRQQSGNIILVSMDGRLLHQQSINLQSGSNTVYINPKAIAHGIYVLRMQVGEEAVSRQFMY